jgi:hypothetical protein
METNQKGLPTISVSAICDACESLKHYHWKRVLKRREETDAMREGTQLHSLILEPEKFKANYFTDINDEHGKIKILKTVEDLDVHADLMGVKLKGKKEEKIRMLLPYLDPDVVIFDHWLQQNEATKEYISPKKWEQLHYMRESVLANQFVQRHLPVAKKEIMIEGEFEGFWLRGKADFVNDEESLPFIVAADLKKCPSAKFSRFKSKVRWEWLFVQAALYKHLLEMKYKKETLFTWIAAESAIPYNTEVYNGNDAMMEVGMTHARKVCRDIHAAMKTGNWTGYTDGEVHPVDLDERAYDEAARIEQEMMDE